ncbi:MAG: hypothetical protein IJU91_05715, partial [Selenomonadaceae bacterium]|nr:hypothetical protein [Selenomonadaceae bacterium]
MKGNFYVNKAFYDNEREIDLDEQKRLYRREKKIIWARTAVFIAGILSLAIGADGYHNAYIVATILFMIFFSLVGRHDEINRRQRFLISRLNVLNSYIVRARGTWRKRSNDGGNYLDDDRPQDVDLYIFGKGSIFQYICAARTKRGRDRLAKSFSPIPPKDFAEVRLRQKGVAELLQRPRLSLDLEALARLMPNNHDTTPLIKAMEEPIPHIRKIFYLRFVPVPIMILIAALALTGNIDSMSALFLLPIVPILSLALAVAMLTRTSEILKPLKMLSQELRLYQAIFERLESTDFNSSSLRKIRDTLTEEVSAAQKLKLLTLLVRFVNTRKNPVAYLFGHALFLMDFFCVAS